jgi:hypothetical protein
MACPTCDHTMQSIGNQLFWCPRCGTLKDRHAETASGVPTLVGRCRDFQETIYGDCAEHMDQWHKTGIRESINPPGMRPLHLGSTT